MTTDMKIPQPKSIYQLKKANYKIYTLDDLGKNRHVYVSSKIDPEIRPKILRCNYWDIGIKFLSLLQPNSRIAITSDQADYRALGAIFKVKPDLLQQTITTELNGIRVYKNNFIYNHIEDVMHWIIPAGIPQKHIKFVFETALWRVDPLPPAPQVFGMKDLEFGFVTWLKACGISIAIFGLELIFGGCKTIFVHIFGVDGFLKILKEKVFL